MQNTSPEWQRISSALSVVDDVAESVTGLHVVSREEVSGWGVTLQVPTGWLSGRYVGHDASQPWRIAVCGPQPDGGWAACETIAIFRFTGTLPVGVLMESADRTLQALESVDGTTVAIGELECAHACGVRSSGFFSAFGLWVWGQFSYYLSNADASGQMLLVQQCLFAEASRRTELLKDIRLLTNSVQSTSFVGNSRS
jgi:hypothetical protein